MNAARAGAGTQVLPSTECKAEHVESMFDRISGRYDLMNRLLTFGLDVRWRRRTVAALGGRSGGIVVDIACGTGDLCRDLMHAGYRTIGVDFSAGMLAAARTTASLVRGDALRLPVRDASVDGVTCGFALRNFTALEPFFAECARVLRPGGRLALLEVAEPTGRIARAGHQAYFRHVVPMVGRLLSDGSAYRYLPESTAYLPTHVELVRAVDAAGFEQVERALLRPGAAQLISGTRR